MTKITQKLTKTPRPISEFGQCVLVLQGGGALGAYQAGVYEALHEAGIEPDWVIGTSIGAINASLIAGNKPERRLERLRAFWEIVEQRNNADFWLSGIPGFSKALTNLMTVSNGISGFFTPNPIAFLSQKANLTSEKAGYYSTAQLEATLNRLVDFSEITNGPMRLSVGAAKVRTAEMIYFDSKKTTLNARHIMASGALPPAFPAIRIDGELYWDGGILSNTPVEAVFDDNPRRNSLVLAVHMWNPEGPEPETIWDVTHRQKDLQYSSRAVSHVLRQKQIHRLRHIIAELAAKLPGDIQASPQVREMASYGCRTRMHVVQLLAPGVEAEDHTKDIDFSRAGIRSRWQAGYIDTKKMIEAAPWEAEVTDPEEGFYLHALRSVG